MLESESSALPLGDSPIFTLFINNRVNYQMFYTYTNYKILYKVKKTDYIIIDFLNVREKIRTPDLLIRSQTLYPAELRVHIYFSMPATGIEPVREYKSRRILSPVRLPVPPRRHEWDLQGSNL